ncbi:LCP family protein [Candidatus Gottesmanbacteria bacterium]|nr:LCP family protein [Candidatus Gottesmanbacteria bacterium]
METLPPKSPKLKIILLGISLIILIIIFLLYPYINLLRQYGATPKLILSLFKNDTTALKNFDGRTNVLLLGISGGNHEGSTLSDSMNVISLDNNKKNGVLISLPRDIWSPSLKDKINSAYAYGEIKQEGGGILLSKSIVEEVIGLPIHYALVIDFSGFKQLIDEEGGIEIDVKNEFIDEKYPIEGKENDECGGKDPEFTCRYELVQFKKGLQHMDGDRALKYVRSRNSQGQEGTDIARARRQQQVLLAIKDKLLQFENLLNRDKLKALIEKSQSSIKTDLTLVELIVFGRSFSDLKNGSIKRPILSIADPIEGKPGFLINPPLYEFDNKWVLIPRNGETEFQEIHQYIQCWIEEEKCTITP